MPEHETPGEYSPTKKEDSFFEEITEENDPFKYDGHLPIWVSATACDSDGDMYAYSHVPMMFKYYWSIPERIDGKALLLKKGTGKCPNWQESLRRV